MSDEQSGVPLQRSSSIALAVETSSKPASAAIDRARVRACLCAKIAEDFRGQDTIVLDLTGTTPIVDFFIITTGTSSRQMKSLAEEVSRVFREHGERAYGTEGHDGGTWILHDYGDIVLHVFNAESRKLYDLEHLWADAPQIDWKALAR